MMPAPPAPAALSPRERWLLPGSLAAAIVLADQLTKLWAVEALGPVPAARAIPLIDDWLRLVYVRNTGVAFGLFQGVPGIFTILPSLIVAGTIYAYSRHLPSHSRWIQVSIGLIVGGGLGNIIDRLRQGYVVDFISVGWFPVFNVADSAISVGVTMLALHLLFISGEPEPAAMPRDDALLGELLSQDVDGGGQR